MDRHKGKAGAYFEAARGVGGIKGFIAVRISQARMQVGLSREQLGKLLGLTEVSVGNIERGKTDVDTPTLLRIAKILGKPIAWFIDEKLELEELYRPPAIILGELEQKLKAYISVYGDIAEGKYSPVIDSVPVLAVGVEIANLRAYRIKGLNCEPWIRDGDTLIVDIAAQPQSGDYVVFKYNNLPLCGLYNETPGETPMINNPDHSWPAQDCQIVGVTIEMHRRFK